MQELVASGKVVQLGISNMYSLEQLRELWARAAVKPTGVQNRFYAETCFDADIRRWCKENGVAYQSFWTLTANGPALQSALVTQIAQERQLSPAQTWFLFVMAEGIVPLTGTTNVAHMQEDLELLSQAPLGDQQRAAVWELVNERTQCAVEPLARRQ